MPSYTLPFRALLLISEYSKPLTRPDWRKSKPCVSTYMLFVYACSVTHRMPCKLRLYKLYQILLTNINNTGWYNLYINIQYIGMHTTSINVKIPIQQLKQISGLNEAERYYKNRS
jgi:hypothetical protein